jgi:hypothetical protein
MMINCLIIGKDRVITTVKVDAKKSNFTHNKGLYTIPKEAVNIAQFVDGKAASYPELIYIEGESLPVNDNTGTMANFLEQTVMANILKQTSKAESSFMEIIKDYAKNPNKLIILAFVGIIVVSFIVGLIS